MQDDHHGIYFLTGGASGVPDPDGGAAGVFWQQPVHDVPPDRGVAKEFRGVYRDSFDNLLKVFRIDPDLLKKGLHAAVLLQDFRQSSSKGIDGVFAKIVFRMMLNRILKCSYIVVGDLHELLFAIRMNVYVNLMIYIYIWQNNPVAR
jgi:hypothetical protein